MSYDVTGKNALVTGANRGIGKAIVESFLDKGVAKVYAAVRNLDSISTLVEKYNNRVIPVRLDLSDLESIVAAAQTAIDVEIVVSNAGGFGTANALAEDAIASLESLMNINVYGLIRMAQVFAPVLKANGGGVFVQLNSVASLKTFADFTTYCTSKAAAYSVTQALRELLSEQGTIVLSVHPGPIATQMGSDAGFAEVAEPPTLIADSIFEALENGDFLVFPDSMAKQVGAAYQSFAENVLLAEVSES